MRRGDYYAHLPEAAVTRGVGRGVGHRIGMTDGPADVAERLGEFAGIAWPKRQAAARVGQVLEEPWIRIARQVVQRHGVDNRAGRLRFAYRGALRGVAGVVAAVAQHDERF